MNLSEVGDRQESGNNRHSNSCLFAAIPKAEEIGVVVEELGDDHVAVEIGQDGVAAFVARQQATRQQIALLVLAPVGAEEIVRQRAAGRLRQVDQSRALLSGRP